MKAAEIMTTVLVTVKPEATIREAAELMVRHAISGLPVVDEAGSLVGILTEGDIIRRAELGTQRQRSKLAAFLLGAGTLAWDYVEAHACRVDEVMTPDVTTVSPDEALQDVVTLMETRSLKRLPVVREGRLVGIVSRADLIRALARILDQLPTTAAGDEALRARITDEIAKQNWAPIFGPSIVVRRGVVHLCGVITNDEVRYALRVIAEGVPGVKAVKDHLMVVEPMSGLVVEPPDGPAPAPN